MRHTIATPLIFALCLTSFTDAGNSPDTSPANSVYHPLPTTLPSGTAPQEAIRVTEIPDALRRDYQLDPFYKKTAAIRGIPIIGSEKVSDYAFLECAWTLDHLLAGRTMANEALV